LCFRHCLSFLAWLYCLSNAGLSALCSSPLPPLRSVGLGSWLLGLLLLFRSCFQPCSEVKGQLKLLASYCEVQCKFSSISRSIVRRSGCGFSLWVLAQDSVCPIRAHESLFGVSIEGIGQQGLRIDGLAKMQGRFLSACRSDRTASCRGIRRTGLQLLLER